MRRITAAAAAALVAAVLTACAGVDADGDDAADVQEETAAGEMAGDEAGPKGAPGDEGAADGAAADDAAAAEQEAVQQDAAREDGGEASPLTATVDVSERDIIYRVDLFLETDDIERAAQRATAIATTSGGFVANEQTSVHGEEETASATLTLRIPSSDYEGVVEQLEDLGEVQDRSRSAEDVTEEVADVESRIESQRRSIDRIRQLLAEASDIGDVVQIESELARREAELDSLLQRQATLSDLTSLATVTVTFHEPGEGPEGEPPATFLSGLSTGWNLFVQTLTVAGAI
ncbi:MAG: DUF4349 domain-containing protein, partial [Jiangellaceae bacterium]